MCRQCPQVSPGAAPQGGASACARLRAPATAKFATENFFLSSVLPQWEQTISGSIAETPERISLTLPHFLQSYSKIGITVYKGGGAEGQVRSAEIPWARIRRRNLALRMTIGYCMSMASRFKARDEFISGLSMIAVFSALWIFVGGGFWIFPLIFAGILPCVRGGVRFFTDLRLKAEGRRELPEPKEGKIERAILTTAKEGNGRVTPAIISLNTTITLENAEKALEEMVRRGYASMDVRDSGTVEYVFPEFLP